MLNKTTFQKRKKFGYHEVSSFSFLKKNPLDFIWASW